MVKLKNITTKCKVKIELNDINTKRKQISNRLSIHITDSKKHRGSQMYGAQRSIQFSGNKKSILLKGAKGG